MGRQGQVNPGLLGPRAAFLVGLLFPNEVVTAPLQMWGISLNVFRWHQTGRPGADAGGRGWVQEDRIRRHKTSEEGAEVHGPAPVLQGP